MLANIMESPKKISVILLGVLVTLYSFGRATGKSNEELQLEPNEVEVPMDVASSDQYNEVVNNLVAENNDLRERLNDIQYELKESLPAIKETLDRAQSVNVSQGITEHEVRRIVEEATAKQHAIHEKRELNTVFQAQAVSADYPIQSEGSEANHESSEMIWISDLQQSNLKSAPESIFAKSSYSAESADMEESSAEPVYTIPENATLMNSVTLTALVGRVPVRGKITEPYPFKIIVGQENLASNGIEIPGVTGIVASGRSTGDLQLSCVRGEINSMTFTFDDGRIVTKRATEQDSLGYLSTPSGNPCITGRLYSNADKHLATDIALASAEGAANALGSGETTATVSDHGTGIETITGSTSRFMLGRGLGNASKTTREWYEARRQDSFDAIYVPINRQVSVHITEAIEIDYDTKGRKVSYDTGKTSQAIAHHLD